MAGVKFTVKNKDMGWDAMIAGSEELTKNPGVRVGVMGKAQHGDGLTVVDIATFHEFGTEHIPQRSFVRATVDSKLNEIKELQKKELTDVLFNGKPAKVGLGRIGAWLAGQMQQRITDRIDPPLTLATIAAKIKFKGNKALIGDVPLIDTGQLRRSITWKVDK
jgi:hypothetical protein